MCIIMQMSAVGTDNNIIIIFHCSAAQQTSQGRAVDLNRFKVLVLKSRQLIISKKQWILCICELSYWNKYIRHLFICINLCVKRLLVSRRLRAGSWNGTKCFHGYLFNSRVMILFLV